MQTIDNCLLNLIKSDTDLNQKIEAINNLGRAIALGVSEIQNNLETGLLHARANIDDLKKEIDHRISEQAVLCRKLSEYHQELKKLQGLNQERYPEDVKLLTNLFARLLGYDQNETEIRLGYDIKLLRKIKRIEVFADRKDEYIVRYIFDFKKKTINIDLYDVDDYMPCENLPIIRKLAFEKFINDLQD